MLLRWIIVALVAALAGFHAVRVAAVRDLPDGLGARLWPQHARVLARKAMAEVGATAARQQPLSPATMRLVAQVAREAPLAPEPFLIHGALAQMAGRDAQAERLFLAARARDPRSEAARYFLADRFLRTGRTAAALAEMSALSRLVPGATAQFAPALASFARTPGAVPELRRFLRRSPEFEPAVLQELTKSPANAELVMSLWSQQRIGAGAAPAWQASLLRGLVEARQYARAQATWSRLAGAELKPGIYNPQFRRDPAPPPFNWSVPGVGGIVEPAPGGVQIIYFGRQDVVLAEQLLLLAPGRYELAVSVRAGAGERNALAWTLKCDSSGSELAALPLGGAANARLTGKFEVPEGCPAQWLQLAGKAGEFSRSVELTMTGLELRQDGQR
ncbi:MAG TPA: hypothetical protein VM265_11525 [Sphingomicrobium sp.]|nr:hypothetical protein [Sphingomicrobium sp.]